MIRESESLKSESLLKADYCIIGGGPAGITIALELISEGKRIILITGGTYYESLENQELNKGLTDPEGSHEPLEENRRRAFGGGTIAWGGRCIPLDPIDFTDRPWIPDSGWPFSYESLIPEFERAMEYCQAGAFAFSVPEFLQEDQEQIIPGLDNEDIRSDRVERWSLPVNFAMDFKKQMAESENLTVLLNCHVTRLHTSGKKKISSVDVRAGDHSLEVRADKFILACGAIENPRLLLASSSKDYPKGIGNDQDNVGRYYMSHFYGIVAELDPSDRKHIKFFFERDQEGVYFRRRWWLTDHAQEKHRIGNTIFFLHRPAHQEGHRDAMFSMRYTAKFFLGILKDKSVRKAKSKWKREKSSIKQHIKVILKNGWRDIPTYLRIASKRFRKRRLPIILPSVNSRKFGLYFQTEHIPNRESRIMISEMEKDRLGVPLPIVKINFSELDKKTIRKAHEVFLTRFREQNLGEVYYDSDELESFIGQAVSRFNSGAHHLGTTRIAIDPAKGVVDADCRVHGMDNLFITGASVFPTGGHANPTLTIVALAIRLANHLKSN